MTLDDEAATVAAGAALAARLRPGDVVTMTGDLGAGKTTFVRGLLHALGHDGEVPSPSFAIVQPYEDLDPRVWHVDLYRLESREELAELGLDSLGDGILIVEWPERAGQDAWPEALRLSLEILDPGRRRLTAGVPAAWEGRWPPQ
jgi:tRNA threonylcarbamoyladenosine biosynthesis protein TsaE